MAKRVTVITIILLVAIAATLEAYEPQVKTLDGGAVTTFIQNDATFGFDPTFSRVAGVGMYYPGDSYRWVLSGGGIWVGGFRDGEWRVSASGLRSDFVPGPYPDPGESSDTLYPIFKINQGDDAGIDDYLHWPIAHGAPVNIAGQPLIKGAQALYTVFNDADTAGHVLTGFTGTLPLGIEVRAYYYTYDELYQVYDTTLAQVMFVDYEVINMTDEPIDSCIITVYADPDIGFSENDRVGSIDTLQSVYAYNETNVDSDYGTYPPVVGLTLLRNRALSGNFYWYCPRSSVPCEDIDTVTKVVNVMKGLRPLGSPYFDPNTSLVTRFPYGGDPVDSVGWLVESSEDYRMLVSTIPRTLEPHASFYATAAVTVVQGDDVKDGIVKTRELLARLREFTDAGGLRPELKVAGGEAVRIRGRGPAADDWGGRFLGGGVDRAERYFGLPESGAKELDDVTISFTKRDQYKALRYHRSGDQFIYSGGMLDVPFEARRGESGEALRVVVLDSAATTGSYRDGYGRLLPLVIIDESSAASPPAAGEAIVQLGQKLLYVVDLNEEANYLAGTTIELKGDVIGSDFSNAAGDGSAQVGLESAAADAFAELAIELGNPTPFWQEIHLATTNRDVADVIPAMVQLPPNSEARCFVRSTGVVDQAVVAQLLIESTSLVVDTLILNVELNPPSKLIAGDADDDGVVTLDDLLQMVAILYKNAPIQVPINKLDADCNGAFNLTDLVLFINYLYRDLEITCQH